MSTSELQSATSHPVSPIRQPRHCWILCTPRVRLFLMRATQCVVVAFLNGRYVLEIEVVPLSLGPQRTQVHWTGLVSPVSRCLLACKVRDRMRGGSRAFSTTRVRFSTHLWSDVGSATHRSHGDARPATACGAPPRLRCGGHYTPRSMAGPALHSRRGDLADWLAHERQWTTPRRGGARRASLSLGPALRSNRVAGWRP